MIQLFARIEDIIPTEPNILIPIENFMDPEEAILADHNFNCISAFLPSIQEHGIKYQLKIHPSGHIGDGNCRYWCGRADRKFFPLHPHQAGFLPIDVRFFTGFYPHDNWRVKQTVSLKPMWQDPVISPGFNYQPAEMFLSARERKRRLKQQ